jgi:hypothetical protein
VGQQPNIRIGIENLPRATPKPGPARRWSPDRPGDITVPGAVPTGGGFGAPGPDAGYALKILAGRDLTLLAGESKADVEAAVAALMTARASHFGRAPVIGDAQVAEAMLGFGTADPSWRTSWTRGLAHDHQTQRALVAAADAEALVSPPDQVRSRAIAGARLVADPG